MKKTLLLLLLLSLLLSLFVPSRAQESTYDSLHVPAQELEGVRFYGLGGQPEQFTIWKCFNVNSFEVFAQKTTIEEMIESARVQYYAMSDELSRYMRFVPRYDGYYTMPEHIGPALRNFLKYASSADFLFGEAVEVYNTYILYEGHSGSDMSPRCICFCTSLGSYVLYRPMATRMETYLVPWDTFCEFEKAVHESIPPGIYYGGFGVDEDNTPELKNYIISEMYPDALVLSPREQDALSESSYLAGWDDYTAMRVYGGSYIQFFAVGKSIFDAMEENERYYVIRNNKTGEFMRLRYDSEGALTPYESEDTGWERLLPYLEDSRLLKLPAHSFFDHAFCFDGAFDGGQDGALIFHMRPTGANVGVYYQTSAGAEEIYEATDSQFQVLARTLLSARESAPEADIMLDETTVPALTKYKKLLVSYQNPPPESGDPGGSNTGNGNVGDPDAAIPDGAGNGVATPPASSGAEEPLRPSPIWQITIAVITGCTALTAVALLLIKKKKK